MVRVGPGEPPSGPWSPSSIDAFLSCPLRYWFTKVARWETPPTVPMVVGSAVHEALEHMLGLPPGERTVETGEGFLADAVSAVMAQAPTLPADEIRARAEQSMAAYWQVEDPRAVEVLGLEREVTAELRGLPMRGFIDRLAVADAGTRVTDYKTGAAKPRYWWGYWRQQILYAAALEAADEPVAEVQLLFLTGPRAVTRPVYASARERALDDLEAAHEQRDAMAETGRWEARTGPLCSWCDFRLVCPAQRSGAPEPGSASSDERLAGMGLRRRSTPVPLESPVADELL